MHVLIVIADENSSVDGQSLDVYEVRLDEQMMDLLRVVHESFYKASSYDYTNIRKFVAGLKVDRYDHHYVRIYEDQNVRVFFF